MATAALAAAPSSVPRNMAEWRLFHSSSLTLTFMTVAGMRRVLCPVALNSIYILRASDSRGVYNSVMFRVAISASERSENGEKSDKVRSLPSWGPNSESTFKLLAIASSPTSNQSWQVRVVIQRYRDPVNYCQNTM